MEVKKGIYNIVFGFIGQFVTIALGIIVPRLFLVNLGSAANGLLSSIGQFLIYLSLLEAGLGGASIQALYNPLSRNDRISINSILSATNKYYKKVGKIYFLCVICGSFIYPFFIDEFSYWTIVIVFCLTGIPGALNFYYQGKFRVLLQAEGKSYIISNISTIISIVTSVSKIVLLNCGCDIIVLQVASCLIILMQMLIYHYYFKKKYKWLNFNETPDYGAVSKKNSVLIHQISNLVLTNTDVLVLTIFTDLKIVSVYTIYHMIFDMINTSVQTVGNSISYIFGKTYFTDRKKFLQLFELYEVYFFALTFSLYTVAYILIKPFLSIYTQGITDIGYIDFYLPLLFTIMKLLASSRTPSLNIINVVGMFKETQNDAIIEALINIIVSIVAVIQYGIYGVLIGTILALLFRAIRIIMFAGKKILHRPYIITLCKWSINVLIFIIIAIVTNYLFEYQITNYGTFLIVAILIMFAVSCIYIIINSVINIREAKALFGYLVRLIRNRRGVK